MSTVTYPLSTSGSSNNNNSNNNNPKASSSRQSGSTKKGLTPNSCHHGVQVHHDPQEDMSDTKSENSCNGNNGRKCNGGLHNSSTMDSGVEDCCEPSIPPSVEMDDKHGKRVTVRMNRPENCGFGFSVVWVTPPR